MNEAAVSAPPLSTLESLADPDGPIPPPRFLETIVGERPKARPRRRLAKVIAAGAVIVALMLAWRFTPLASLARPDTIRQWFAAIAQAPAAPLLVIAAFVGGGLMVFPVLVLIAATAAAFGPWLGFAYAFAGGLASAISPRSTTARRPDEPRTRQRCATAWERHPPSPPEQVEATLVLPPE
jgi:phospholipase D1/2